VGRREKGLSFSYTPDATPMALAMIELSLRADHGQCALSHSRFTVQQHCPLDEVDEFVMEHVEKHNALHEVPQRRLGGLRLLHRE
jgi:hypothetical protein